VIVIRYARSEDGRPIRRMVFDVLCEYGVPADPDDSDADIMDFGSSKVPGVMHLVADLDGTPVGSAVLTPHDARRVKLSKLFVRTDCRRLGIGRQLLAEAVQEATRSGYSEIFLTTRALYREAVNLYERNKWLRGMDQPPPGAELLYYLPLPEGPARLPESAARAGNA
jgi:GNAT superfamily N-acetyltransferase